MTTTINEEKKKISNKTSNDPIADFLTRVRNAVKASKKQVAIPYSKFKLNLAELLQEEGYFTHVQIINEDDVSTKSIVVDIKYANKQPVIKGLRKISKPGLRKYVKSQYAPKVMSGLGISILSTNKGLKTDRKARTENVGGEIVCQVW